MVATEGRVHDYVREGGSKIFHEGAMSEAIGLKVVFVAGFGPIIKDAGAAKAFYADALGLPMEQQPDNPDYLHSEKIDGVRHFALWPLREASRACFGRDDWPTNLPEPHAWLEFDVEDVAAGAAELKRRGYSLLVEAREEPWGQTVARVLSPEGLLVGLTFTPWMR
jgi:catechol 2,3-dioxygenase-like lactoylglutathione lyase family enzyme